jgi:hypothetical protein
MDETNDPPTALGVATDADRACARARLLSDDLADAFAARDALAVYAVGERLMLLGSDVAGLAAILAARPLVAP